MAQKDNDLRIILVDSSEVFRMGMRALLSEARELHLADEASDAAAAVAAARSNAPAVVIADLELPETSGSALVGSIREVAPAARILFLASDADESLVRQAISAGASGVVLKSQPAREILSAVREVAAGRTIAPPARRASARVTDGESPKAAVLDRLSAREREIFDLIIWGKTNKQVAVKLGISVKTVETHRSHINGKLQVHSAAELVRLASLCGVLARGQESVGASVNDGAHVSHERTATVDRLPLPRLVAKSG